MSRSLEARMAKVERLHGIGGPRDLSRLTDQQLDARILEIVQTLGGWAALAGEDPETFAALLDVARADAEHEAMNREWPLIAGRAA